MKTILILLCCFLITPIAANACQSNFDCPIGSVCLIQAGNVYGACYATNGSINVQ